MTNLPDLRGQRVLVVDDNYLVATSMASVLKFAGAQIVEVVSRLDDAMALVAANSSAIDAVVLDVDLGGTESYPLAEALDRIGIPYVFVTGYDNVSPQFDHRPTCPKPVSAEALCAVIASITR